MAEPERPTLTGYMVLDDWAEDYSYWSGQITGPDNPRGANLAWLDPIPMIEKREFDQVVKERDFASQQWRDWNAEAEAQAEKLEAHDASASREIDRLQGNWEAAEKEVAQLKLALEIAKELRIYCLGTDASTESMIQRFDAAIRALSEKECTE